MQVFFFFFIHINFYRETTNTEELQSFQGVEIQNPQQQSQPEQTKGSDIKHKGTTLVVSKSGRPSIIMIMTARVMTMTTTVDKRVEQKLP